MFHASSLARQLRYENAEEVRGLAAHAIDLLQKAHDSVAVSNKVLQQTTSAIKVMKEKLSMTMGQWIESVKEKTITQSDFEAKKSAGEKWLQDSTDTAWCKNKLSLDECTEAKEAAVDAIMSVWHLAKPVVKPPETVDVDMTAKEVADSLDEELAKSLAALGLPHDGNPYAVEAAKVGAQN